MEAYGLNFQQSDTNLSNRFNDIQVYYNEEYYQNKLLRKRMRAQIQKRRRVQALRRFLFFCFVIFCTAGFWGVNTFAKNIFKNEDASLTLQFNTNQMSQASRILGEKISYSYENSLINRDFLLRPIALYQEDSVLTNHIKALVANYKNLTCHLFIYNVSTGQYVDINGRSSVPAASIIKIPVLFAMLRHYDWKDLQDMKLDFKNYHRALGSGKLQYSMSDRAISVLDIARVMIRESDNTATNILLDSVGGMESFNKELQSWGASKTEMNNWLPDLEGTNLTTPYDMANMLYNINNSQFLSPEARESIEHIMSNISNRSLINFNLPEGTVLLNKTGDIGTMLGDAGIIRLPNGMEVIIVAMIERPWNSYSAKELIHNISMATTSHYNH